MRVDERLTKLSAPTTRQRYFLGSWFNMVHMYSLDSYRVRVMNSKAALREVHRCLTHAAATTDDKLAILSEAETVVNNDPVLKLSPFNELADSISAILKNDKERLATQKMAKLDERMLFYFLAELQPLLETKYQDTAFDELQKILSAPDADGASEEILENIHQLTGNLLSTILDRGVSLESLYSLYAQILVPRAVDNTYQFEKKIGLVRAILSNKPQPYTVTFAVDWISEPNQLPTALGDLTLSDLPPFELQNATANQRYLKPGPKRKFATVEKVEASDERAAGSLAFEQVNNVVHLLRFEYENARIEVGEQFAIKKHDQVGATGKMFRVPRVLPNPELHIKTGEAVAFVTSVRKLLSGSKFNAEGSDRINSAFRLYRQGRDHESVDTKLVNWWTALEYLVRGNSVGNSIGKSVEDSLAPVMANCYIAKLLVAARHVISELDVHINDSSGNLLDIKTLNISETLVLFRGPPTLTVLLRELASQPFILKQIKTLVADVADANSLHKKIEQHEQRVRWQVERIWRARCDVVHSAGRGTNLPLLCSNLEYYLKTALHGILKALRSLTTLGGPHEFFDREAFCYTRMMKGLQNKDERFLFAAISAESY